MVKGDKDSLLV